LDFAIDPEGLALKASIASPGLFYRDNQPVHMLIYSDDLMLIGLMNDIIPICRKLHSDSRHLDRLHLTPSNTSA
jgi:hypothetical protein